MTMRDSVALPVMEATPGRVALTSRRRSVYLKWDMDMCSTDYAMFCLNTWKVAMPSCASSVSIATLVMLPRAVLFSNDLQYTLFH